MTMNIPCAHCGACPEPSAMCATIRKPHVADVQKFILFSGDCDPFSKVNKGYRFYPIDTDDQ